MNMFEWCNEGITPEIQNLQYLDYETGLGLDWMDNYNEEGLFFCPDIRTPMNAIVGLTALSLDEQDLSPRVRENLINIRGSSDFLLGLVNDTLDMSKIESGAVTLKLEPYYYTDFLAKMKAMFEPQCNAKNIDFTFEDGGHDFSGKQNECRYKRLRFIYRLHCAKWRRRINLHGRCMRPETPQT